MQKAFTRAKITTGTYILQSTRAKFNQYQVSQRCPLCQMEDETLQHFLLECKSLEPVRKPFVDMIRSLMPCHMLFPNTQPMAEDLLQVILDPTMNVQQDNVVSQLFSFSRSLCFAVHVQRNVILGQSMMGR